MKSEDGRAPRQYGLARCFLRRAGFSCGAGTGHGCRAFSWFAAVTTLAARRWLPGNSAEVVRREAICRDLPRWLSCRLVTPQPDVRQQGTRQSE